MNVLCGQIRSLVLKLAVRILMTRNENMWHLGDYILNGWYSDYGLLGCDAVWKGSNRRFQRTYLPNHATYIAVYCSLSLFIVYVWTAHLLQ